MHSQYFCAVGVVERTCGSYNSPELLALGLPAVPQPLYRVRFRQADLWGGGGYSGHPNDTVDVEIYEPWLAPAVVTNNYTCVKLPSAVYRAEQAHSHSTSSEDHMSRAELEQAAVNAEGPERPYRRVVEALKMVLLDKGMLTLDALRAQIEEEDMDNVGPALGARLVVEAWMNPAFKARLLADGKAGMAELGIAGTGQSADLVGSMTTLVPYHFDILIFLHCRRAQVVVENTDQVHNLVVCTLCSCYASALLGWPPDWFKSRSYRARAVREPRKVLAEFGLEIPSTTAVSVHDSTADLRYLVLPVCLVEVTHVWHKTVVL
eukprot:SAG31_NODE_5474_length_2518_cov_544.966102_1_plen_320_part_00